MDLMPFSKISTKHQVTIPQEVFDKLQLRIGDHVEVVADKDRIIMTPQRMVAQKPVTKLTARDQELLISAKKKIKAINEDMINSKGLTRREADVAAKAGLIDPDQRYWWLEEWQEGEREAERDVQEGRTAGPFETAEALFAHLDQQRV